jgi:hypothetical protein
LKIRHRFASASAAGISPLDFSIKLLGLWGGKLTEVKVKPVKEKSDKESPDKAKSNLNMPDIASENLVSSIPAAKIEAVLPETKYDAGTPNSTSEVPEQQPNQAQAIGMEICQAEGVDLKDVQNQSASLDACVPTEAIGSVGVGSVQWEQTPPVSEISMSEKAPSLYEGPEQKDPPAILR